MQPSRSLLTFAVIAESFTSTGDIAQGLMPLFEPIAADFSGKRFDAPELAKEIKLRYDMEIPVSVIEDWSKRLETEGLLENISIMPGVVDYKYKKIAPGSAAVSSDDIDRLLKKFTEYVNKSSQGTFLGDDVELQKSFFTRLVRLDTLAKLHGNPEHGSGIDSAEQTTLHLRKVQTEDSQPTDDNSKEFHIDYLFGRFVESLSREGNGDLDLLVKISAGAVFTEVVFSFQNPPKKGDALDGADLFLDAPIAMDLLGLDPKRAAGAKELLDSIKKTKAKISIFDHSIDEINRAIHARSSDSGFSQRRLTALDKILLTKLSGRVPQELEKLGVSIMRFQGDAYLRSLSHFNEEQESELFSALNFHSNEQARTADARSIATVERLRRNRKCPIGAPLLESGPILVTRNPALAAACRRAMPRIVNSLNQQGFSAKTEADVCVLDRYLAGLLWIVTGGSANQLTQSQLVANCAAAAAPKRGLIKRAVELLRSIDADQAMQLEAIVQDERAEHYLADLALNDAALLTADNMQEIFEKVRLSVGREVEARLTDKFNQEIEEKDKVVAASIGSITASYQNDVQALKEGIENKDRKLLETETQLFVKDGELNKSKNENKALVDGIDAAYKENMSDLLWCINKSKSAGSFCIPAIGLILASLIFWAQNLITNIPESLSSYSKPFAMSLAIVSFWVAFGDTPGMLFNPLRMLTIKTSYRLLVLLTGIKKFAKQHNVNWSDFSVQKIK